MEIPGIKTEILDESLAIEETLVCEKKCDLNVPSVGFWIGLVWYLSGHIRCKPKQQLLVFSDMVLLMEE